jgi:hypothetical protein
MLQARNCSRITMSNVLLRRHKVHQFATRFCHQTLMLTRLFGSQIKKSIEKYGGVAQDAYDTDGVTVERPSVFQCNVGLIRDLLH